jgi:predicted DNA-binding antitoxin AbrB/MazE fold protein
MAKPKKAPAKTRTIRARVHAGNLEPLDKISLREGDEVAVKISEPPSPKDLEALRRAAGGWKGIVDAEDLIEKVYTDRLLATRPPPRV